MAQFFGFGSGKDGVLNVTSNTTESPVDSSCSGSSGATTLSATNASFQSDDMILVHQSRGTGVGSWEINFIDSYVAGTITTTFELSNTYTDSGVSQAQVRVVPEYSSVNIASGVTYSAKAWNANVGGILFFVCSGHVQVDGTISASGKGYLGGSQTTGSHQNGRRGEGYNIARDTQTHVTLYGAGGGGGFREPDGAGSGGGGGGHSTSGATGSTGHVDPGQGGGTYGVSSLETILFGAGGGSGGASYASQSNGYGGNGGGIIMIFSNSITVNGSIVSNGSAGGNTEGHAVGAGGGGAGGSILIFAVSANIGTNKITALGGSGGLQIGSFPIHGGAGGNGRVRVQACEFSGTSNPSASTSIGGHDYCQSFIHIYG